MSYDIKLGNICNHTIYEEEQIVDSDYKTVVLNRPITNTEARVKVKINDFERKYDSKFEMLNRENVSEQITITNTKNIYLSKAPIFNGNQTKKLADIDDVIVKIKIIDENVSEQFTGNENYFYTEGKTIIKNDEYDFSTLITTDDIEIKLNGDILEKNKISDIDSKFGRIQLTFNPLSTDEVLVTYNFRAKILEMDSTNGTLILKESPKVGQTIIIAYYSLEGNGWILENSKRSLIPNTKDIIFDTNHITSRVFVQNESIPTTGEESQFDGTNSTFKTKFYPILPLYQSFNETFYDTLNNSVYVTVNGEKVQVLELDPEKGYVKISYKPQKDDIVLVTYYYQALPYSDRISIDYVTTQEYCNKCQGNADLSDYIVDNVGNYVKVEFEEKLIQDLKKIVITVKGSDKNATWYGTIFNTIVGLKQIPNYLKTRISSEIISALSNLKNAQIQQEQYQEVSDEEFLDYIKNITVNVSEIDSSYYTATVSVVNQAGRAYSAENINLNNSAKRKLYTR